MAHAAFHRGRIPEKWERPWKIVRSGLGKLLLNEPLVFEIYHQIARSSGKEKARIYILGLKARNNVQMMPSGDADVISFLSAQLKLKHEGLSLVDSYNLAIAKSEKAILYTTDHGLRDAARAENCSVNWLPREALT